MKHPVIDFSIKLLVVLVIVFGLHIATLHFLEKPLFEDKITLSYVVNAIMAIIIFLVLFKLKTKYKDQLGFLFLFGSTFKFAVFFLLFYKAFKLDGIVTKLEFASFFIPYMLCLLIETFSLSKWLNKMD